MKNDNQKSKVLWCVSYDNSKIQPSNKKSFFINNQRSRESGLRSIFTNQ